jgi:mono/diheme cytochrome c family protein
MNGFSRTAVLFGLAGLLACCATTVLFAQLDTRSQLHLDSGEAIYKSACIACHGPDGTGTPKSIAGFERPRTFPDFTRCDQTTPEENSAWKAVIANGGTYRGFSPIMPSFKEALSDRQIDQVVKFLRGFCRQKRWPRGELNLPRAIITEKAYPEDEAVISSSINAEGAPGLVSHIIHEQRFGKKNQLEIDVPLNFQDENHTWYGGVGDVTFGLKRVMFSNLHAGSILSLQGSVIVPTGNRQRGFGSGTTTFETFAAFDQLFPTNTFIQTQLGADLPRHTDIASQAIFFNTAVGQSFASQHGLGRLFTPMMEFVANRDLVDGAKTDWDILPEMQVTISKRQHIRADLGVRVPVNNASGRSRQIVFYLLWDWQDGRLNEGW